MSRNMLPLDMIQVASPCQVSWDSMQGDQTTRFCGQCNNHVYNLSAMSRSQAEQLIEETEGRLCVRFYRRQDGTMMTRDCPASVQTLRRWLAIMIGSAAAFLLMLVGVSLAVLGLNSGAHSITRDSGQGAPTPSRQVFQVIYDWINPQRHDVVMGEPAPVMGKMAAPPVNGK